MRIAREYKNKVYSGLKRMQVGLHQDNFAEGLLKRHRTAGESDVQNAEQKNGLSQKLPVHSQTKNLPSKLPTCS